MKNLTLPALLILSTSTVWADDIGKYQEESRAVVMPFMKQLMAENQKAVSEGGPESAIMICKDVAPDIVR